MDLGERIKFYESTTCNRVFTPTLPVIARLDGKSFHKFTKGLDRPYDSRLCHCFDETTKYLVEKTNAVIGYTQSDEITLIYLGDWNSQIYFDGKTQKMISVLAADCTLHFYNLISEHIPDKRSKNPLFDCRCFSVPSKMEACNALIWREQDAVRNSIQMSARHYYSHHQCHEKSCSELQDMLMAKGVNWNDYPARFKRGTYFKRVKEKRKFSPEELAKMPPKHDAVKNPNVEFVRTSVREVNFPILTKAENVVELVFGETL